MGYNANANFVNWMGDRKDKLRNRKLKDIALPGSHDAGTWDLRDKINDVSAKCQDHDIMTQLQSGSRYLDLRAHCGSNGKFYMRHGEIWTDTELDDVISQIMDFANRHPTELIVATMLLRGSGADEKVGEVQQRIGSRRIVPDGTDALANRTYGDVIGAGTNVVLETWSAADGKFMDMKGVYNSDWGWPSPNKTEELLNEYTPPSRQLWILHLNLSYGVPLLDSHKEQSKRALDHWAPKFRANALRIKSLNIINVDFISSVPWVPVIVAMND